MLVMNLMLQRAANYQEVNMNSIVISAICHDLCKIGSYEVKQQWRKPADKWESYNGYGSKSDGFPFGHGEKSAMMASKLVGLTDPELLAIRWHMGIPQGNEQYTWIEAAKVTPLVAMLHSADLESSFALETDGVIECLAQQ
jgi:HD superfamily phosphohydrolase YqeK